MEGTEEVFTNIILKLILLLGITVVLFYIIFFVILPRLGII